MHGESSDCEGVVDTGLLILAHFDNPGKEYALRFLRDALEQKSRLLIPTSTFIGAFHIMVRYLHLPQADVAHSLTKTLSLHSPAYYEQVRKEDIITGFGYALSYTVEMWDSFLLSLARRFGTRNIFSIDGELKRRAKDFIVTNPIPPEIMEKYHAFAARLLRK